MKRDIRLAASGVFAVVIATLGIGSAAAGRFAPPVSPEILFVDQSSGKTGGLWVMNGDGSGRKQIVKGADLRRPTWSPDGTMIAYYGNPKNKSGIYVANADGTNARRIVALGVSGTAALYALDWASDRMSDGIARIAFIPGGNPSSGGGEVFVVKPDGTGLTQVTDSPADSNTACGWTREGDRILYSRPTNTGEAEMVSAQLEPNANGTVTVVSEEVVLGPVPGVYFWDVRYANTFEGFAFRNTVDNRIWVADFTGPTPVVRRATSLANPEEAENSPSFSQDDTKIAFSINATGAGPSTGIAVVNADGTGETTVINPNDMGGVWSNANVKIMPYWRRPAN